MIAPADVTHHVGDRRVCTSCGARVFAWGTDGTAIHCRTCATLGAATPLDTMTDAELAAERRALFGYTEPAKLARSRIICDEIARRAKENA